MEKTRPKLMLIVLLDTFSLFSLRNDKIFYKFSPQSLFSESEVEQSLQY